VPAQVTLSGKTIKGVLYIQAPNNIRFDGGTMMPSIIVTDATPGSPTSNLLTFSGNVTMTGVESLNPATFGDLPNLGGSLILAPNFHITFTGTSGVAGGTMAGGQFTFSGNTGLNLHGSVIGLDPTKPMTVGGSGSITIKPPTWNGVPTGLTFQKATKGFQPVFSTFSEVPQ
jgi:hypothetical protein